MEFTTGRIGGTRRNVCRRGHGRTSREPSTRCAGQLVSDVIGDAGPFVSLAILVDDVPVVVWLVRRVDTRHARAPHVAAEARRRARRDERPRGLRERARADADRAERDRHCDPRPRAEVAVRRPASTGSRLQLPQYPANETTPSPIAIAALVSDVPIRSLANRDRHITVTDTQPGSPRKSFASSSLAPTFMVPSATQRAYAERSSKPAGSRFVCTIEDSQSRKFRAATKTRLARTGARYHGSNEGLIVAWALAACYAPHPGRGAPCDNGSGRVRAGQRCDPIHPDMHWSGRGRCRGLDPATRGRCEPMRRERGLRERHVRDPDHRSKLRRSKASGDRLRDARSKLVAISRARRRQSDLCRVSLCATHDAIVAISSDGGATFGRSHRITGDRSTFRSPVVRARPLPRDGGHARRRVCAHHDGGATWTTTPLDATVPSVNWGVRRHDGRNQRLRRRGSRGEHPRLLEASGGTVRSGRSTSRSLTDMAISSPTHDGTVWVTGDHTALHVNARAATRCHVAAQVDPIGSSYNFSTGGRGAAIFVAGSNTRRIRACPRSDPTNPMS